MLENSQEMDDTTRQAWAAQFNGWQVKEIVQISADNDLYRVQWSSDRGGDTRWFKLVKNNDQIWKISQIATGP